MTLACDSHGTGNKLVNPIQQGGQIAPGINPKYGQMDRPCTNDSKSYDTHGTGNKFLDPIL